MKKTILFLLSLFVGLQASLANVRFTSEHYGRNIIVAADGNTGAEFSNNEMMLIFMLSDLNRLLFRDSLLLYVGLKSNDDENIETYEVTYTKKRFFLVGNDTFNFKRKFDSSIFVRRALEITSYSNHPNLTNILKLIYEVSKNPRLHGAVNNNNINNIISNNYPELDTIFRKKYFRYTSKVYDNWYGVNYYYQHQKYYLYKLENQENYGRNRPTNNVLSVPYKPLYSFNYIYQIATDQRNHCLIFINDSIFYHYSIQDEKLKGPFSLPYKIYLSIEDPLECKTDSTIIIKSKYDEVNFIYNFKSDSIIEELNPKIKDMVLEKRAIENKKKMQVQKEREDALRFAQRRPQLPYFILTILLVNGFLIWLARKPKTS